MFDLLSTNKTFVQILKGIFLKENITIVKHFEKS